MDKQTLSNYGWVIVVVLVLAVMLGLATPFGKYVGVGIGNIAKAYKEASNADAIDKNVDTMRDEWNSFFGNETTPKFGDGKIEYGKNDPDLNHTPAIGVYYKNTERCYCGSFTSFNHQNNYCSTCQYEFTLTPEVINEQPNVFENSVQYAYIYNDCIYILNTTKEWHCYVYDRTVSKYEFYILETIAGYPVVGISFFNLSCLVDVSEIVLPETLKYVDCMFQWCGNLEYGPKKIPSNISSTGQLFDGCNKLKMAPSIPSGVNDMYYTFNGCCELSGQVEINANPTRYDACFQGVDFKTQQITLTGTSTMLDTLGATGYNYCNECNGYCEKGHTLINPH